MSEPLRHTLSALLDWTIAMGADAAVADEAIDWLQPDRLPPGAAFSLSDAPQEPPLAASRVPGSQAQARAGVLPPRLDQPDRRAVSQPAPRAGAPATPPPVRKFATASPEVAVGAARAAARTAATLEELHRALQAFEGCSLKATAKNLCFYRGAPSAPLMIIGEAPGRDEDLEGRPFVGRSGQLLDRMLSAAGWSESDAHITNIVYWRPPGNRTPTPQEAEVCRPFLERQIELVEPRAILLMGGAASRQIFRSEEGIMKIRGQWQTLRFADRDVPVMASLHPAYVLRQPASKRLVWRDFLALRDVLTQSAPPR
jgi:DNA polymerase